MRAYKNCYIHVACYKNHKGFHADINSSHFNVKVTNVNHKIKHMHIFLVACQNSIANSFKCVKFNF